MDERPDQIAQHIESKRSELGRNLDELQTRVRESADWRKQFDRHPYVMMGAALGGGMLLSSMVGGSSSSPRYRSSSSGRSFPSESMPHTSSYYMNQGHGSSAWPAWSSQESNKLSSSSPRTSGSDSSSYSPQRQQAWGMFENIKTALFGLAAARAQEYLNDMLPGFREHFQQAQQGRSGSNMMGLSGNQQQQNPQQNWGQQYQSWRPGEHQQPWNLGQGMHHENEQRWGGGEHQPSMGRSFNQPEQRWSGQQESWRQPSEQNQGHQQNPGQHNQGQWPQERGSWDRERNWDRERQQEGQGSFRR